MGGWRPAGGVQVSMSTSVGITSHGVSDFQVQVPRRYTGEINYVSISHRHARACLGGHAAALGQR